jgi:hypothetical protein
MSMHVKNIHSMIEKLSEVAKCELDKGVENIDTKEMGEVAEIIKELSEAEYYAKISKAMDEAEYGEDYDYMGAYDEHERKGYRGQRRDSRGRYMSRRGYEAPMMMHDDREYMRDMDRMDGRMYYTSGENSISGSTSGNSSMNSGSSNMGYSESGSNYGSRMQRDSREGKSGQMRRGYMEAKEQGKDKTEKMKSLEDYMKSMAEDLTEAIENASPAERSMVKNKLSVLTQKM